MKQNLITQVRKSAPLIHHLTNQVVTNFTANGVLSFGAAPVMAKAKEEVADMAAISQAVVLNIGTIIPAELEAMIIAGEAANKHNIPVVIDPVGIAATPYRTEVIAQLLKYVKPTVIKGNIGELAHLVDIQLETKGVEAVGTGDGEVIARQVAKKYDSIAVITGEIDYICDGDTLIQNNTGHVYLENITGAGCLLGSIIAACLTTNEAALQACHTAVAFYGLAAEYAAALPSVNGSGTFLPHFVDALSFDVETLRGDTLS